MKRPLTCIGLLTFALITAAPQGVPKIEDTQSRALEITNYRSWRAEKTKEGNVRLTVRGPAGGKVVANWKLEGMRLEASELVMLATQKDFRLISANLSGGIELVARRPSKVAGATQILTVNAPSATYQTSTQVVDINGAFSLDRVDNGTSEAISASGSQGKLVLSPRSKDLDALQSATITGPVKFDMAGKRLDEGKRVNFKLNGRGDRLTYGSDDRKVVLAGNVTLSGDDPSLAGAMTGIEKAVITLDATGEIESVDMEANPGKTIIDPKTKIPPRR